MLNNEPITEIEMFTMQITWRPWYKKGLRSRKEKQFKVILNFSLFFSDT